MHIDIAELQEKGSAYFVLFGICLVVGAWLFFRPKDQGSRFKLRESERLAKSGGFSQSPPQSQNQAKSPQAGPKLLEGIRLDVEPHELLNVSFNANRDEIMKAYRDLMKRYHPDKVGRPGTPEWQDAQKIAESVNRAKDILVARLGKS